MGKPGSQKKGASSRKGARGATKKTIAKKAKTPAKPRSQGASKKTTTQRAKTQAKPRSQGASKKNTTQKAKTQAKPKSQGASKKNTTQKAKTQAKPKSQGASKTTSSRPPAKPRNQGAPKKTTTQRAQPQAIPSMLVVQAPAAPVVQQNVQNVNFNTPGNALPRELYREEGPAPKRPRVSPTATPELRRPGNELAHEAYEEDSPAPKRRKTVRDGTPSDDELEKLANEIPDWKKLGRRLGIKDSKLTSIERDYTGTTEQAYQMLKHWKESKASEATYNVLFEALSDKERVSRTDLAEKYCCQTR
ncbi:uncharacterized protein LOC144631672 isoform X4 [Oculina patagonica]